MSGAVIVVANDKEVEAWLKQFGRQVPFAASLALNQTGTDILQDSRDRMRRQFTQRTYSGKPFLADEKLIGWRRATKTRLEAKVGIGNPGASPKSFQRRLHDIYARQEYDDGTAQAGRNDFYIPADRPDNPSYQPPRKLYPTALGLAARRGINGSWIEAKSRNRKKSGGYFILPQVNGEAKGYGIYYRDTGSRGPGTRGDISAVWFLRPSIRRRRRPFFEESVRTTVDQRWAVNMGEAIDRAMRTAR